LKNREETWVTGQEAFLIGVKGRCWGVEKAEVVLHACRTGDTEERMGTR